MIIESFKRWEEKFIITKQQYDEVLKRISPFMENDEYSGDSFYPIFSIYYDTVSDNVALYSSEKPNYYYKEKLRLRSYGKVENDSSRIFIEIKKKIDGVGSKRRVYLPYSKAMKFLDDRKIPDSANYTQKQIMKEIAYYLDTNEVYPKVFIACERKALFAKNDNSLRITFDRNVVGRRTNVDFHKSAYGRSLIDNDTYIMEVKMNSAIPFWLSKILNGLYIHSRSFSKFGTEFKLYSKENKENISVGKKAVS
ncbi:MAG: polyphosphate polymerase domain-containing protein [Clostridia bacterium]|jgi:SPX domain protein involved in polyphosphate accumulation|nr:polyphosphate polymerase domain-containing protein [Clostridia bacterium]MCI1999337.1 polyphosphate polymerase domain-containing protein [Clostridia bacterium]MCI2015161.1 polyphosphate polymerase domain-containing protein [Clostridia bacterium]